MALGLVVALLAVTMPATAIAPISESSYAETRLWTFEHQDPAGSRAERGLSRTGIEGYQLSSWKPRRAVPFTRGGQQVALHNYFPFGQEATSAEADEIQLKFTGHERDKTGTGARSELDYMHARHCSPVVGRFLSVDPAKSAKPSAPGSWNRYSYAGNNPINEIDPNGRESRAAMALEQDIQRLMRGEITQEQYIENINARGMGALFAASLLSPVDETTLVVAVTRKALPSVGSKLSAVFARLGKVFQRGSRGGAKGAASVDDLLRAGQQLDRNGLSRAGRSLQKHGDRADSVFPRSTGNAAARNDQGQQILEEILNSSNQTTRANRLGGRDIFDTASGRGVRFDGDGQFIGFLDP